MAGNQFSVPLIDFEAIVVANDWGWESVLRPPDRLRKKEQVHPILLGISSPSP